ncbi:MAG TPA: aldo/keto reductase, partial [Candidatus Methylomirabilis sp.]|nr:aldo/keto reductase [Candidatus Methylomirabilis sp.]
MEFQETSRRGFLKITGAAAGLAAAGPLLRSASGASPSAAEPSSQTQGTEKRALGTTGFRVTTVSFGAMTTRDPEVIRFAVDRGVDYVDTADCYMGGENERIVGRALAGVRDKVVLASKVHIAPVDQMIRSAENSLRSLKVDVIDILQLHGISTEGEVTDGRAREALQKLIDQGKVRVAGVTTHSGQETVLRAVQKHGFYKTVLVAYNFRSDKGVTATVKGALGLSEGLSNTIRSVGESGVGIIGMKTQAGGYPSPPGGASPHQAALAWVLSNPGVATTIPSMTTYAQVEENLGARGKRLSFGDRFTLHRYAMEIGDRHCGLCGACAGQCPQGVDVPSVLRSLTYLEGYREAGLARDAYRSLSGGKNAAACGDCDRCLVACRLRLPVLRLAREAH